MIDLFDKLQLNILKVNKLLEKKVNKVFYDTTEYKSKVNGDIEIKAISKGNPVQQNVVIGNNNISIYKDFIGGIFIDSFLGKSKESDVFGSSIRRFYDGRNGTEYTYKLKISKNDTIKISNLESNSNSKITNPKIQINNKDVITNVYSELINYQMTEVTSASDNKRFDNFTVGEIYNYSLYERNYNGKSPGEGGKVGRFKFRYLGKTEGTIYKLDTYDIEIIEKEGDGVPFPHGQVSISFKLDIDLINFDSNIVKGIK
ncbi:hypothetical protein ACWNT8_15580 (plasmid) [Pigmentibacter ruber]